MEGRQRKAMEGNGKRRKTEEGRGKLVLISALALLVSAGQARAQLTISASVDKKAVQLDDSVTLSVAVSGAVSDVPDPQLPSLPNFNIYSSGRSQNISIINGKISSSITHTFILTPRFVGKAVIGPVRLDYKGQRYETSPMEIAVVRPSAAQSGPPPAAPSQAQTAPRSRPQAGQRSADAFVTAETDRKKAYVNEQLNLTVRFYTAVQLMGNPEYIPPSASGFISEDLPPMRTGETTINGRNYYYTEIKTALFGAQPGPAAIEQALVRCQFRQSGDTDPFAPDFFQKFFSQGMGGQTKELRTEVLHVRIEPLPETGKPASFAGAVGKFRIYSSVDRKELKAGEAANLSITIEGTGNLKTITAPALPDMPAFRVYDMVSSLNLKKDGDIVRGSKTYKTVIIPRASGKHEIPAIKFSFFDPASGSYHEISSLPIEINVLPGAPGEVKQFAFTPSGNGGEITSIVEDIHYITEKTRLGPVPRALMKTAGLSRIHALPFLVFFFSLASVKLRHEREKNPAAFRYRKAFAKARTVIKEAENSFHQNKVTGAVSALSSALTDYLSDKLGTPVTGITFKKTVELVNEKFPGVSPETLSLLEKTWSDLELLRFAPGEGQRHSDGGRPITLRMAELINALEKELRK